MVAKEGNHVIPELIPGLVVLEKNDEDWDLLADVTLFPELELTENEGWDLLLFVLLFLELPDNEYGIWLPTDMCSTAASSSSRHKVALLPLDLDFLDLDFLDLD